MPRSESCISSSVIISAATAREAARNAVNISGIVQARSVRQQAIEEPFGDAALASIAATGGKLGDDAERPQRRQRNDRDDRLDERESGVPDPIEIGHHDDAVHDGDPEQRNKSDRGREVEVDPAKPQCPNPADQRERND